MKLILPNKRVLLLVGLDCISILFSLLLAFYLRIENAPVFIGYLLEFWWVFPLMVAVRIGIFRNMGFYYWSSQYFSLHELTALARAIGLSVLIVLGVLFVFRRIDFPFIILAIDGLVCFMLIGGSRLTIRLLKERQPKETNGKKNRRLLIVGAGDAGEMMAREILKLPRLGYELIGFVDDNQEKIGKYIHQLPVLGKVDDLIAIVEKYSIEDIVIAIPSARSSDIRRIVDCCEKSGAKFRIVPGVFELIDGTVHINQVRNVQIEDLLGRDPVSVDIREIASYLTGVPVLVTGAGGSIGSEICRQVALYQPSELIILGRGENSIFEIENELKARFPYLNLHTLIGNICDPDRMEYLFKKFKPAIIFHAAAHKHVSLMERNPSEAILNNVFGTKTIADLADKYQADRFINISTDKAVKPSSIMGSAKRLAERIIQAKANSKSRTRFVSVRFGNVLGSRGSVIPIFQKQIAAGGPVTVTHPEAKRYFMTIPEAVQLVIQAGAMGKGGEVFVLDMGEPVKIVDLAKDMIKLSGFEVGRDIEIQYIGLRPGEKLFEELLTPTELPQATNHRKIFTAVLDELDEVKMEKALLELEKAAHANDDMAIKEKLRGIIKVYGTNPS